jgi:Mn2+/Fe2+ NRAMP family transporter
MKQHSAILGAAFLMATSAIGPGFLNNTNLFTSQVFTSFGFVILVSILLDIGAQLNIWRIVSVSGNRAQDLANKVWPGLGYVLAILIAIGGLAFNIGNVAGCGLGIEVLTGLDPRAGAAISCIIALIIFWTKDAGKAVDLIVKILGIAMIGLTLYVMFSSDPPYGKAIQHSFLPEIIDPEMIIAIVGGTVGGYISFAGAHRLLDAGIKGPGAIQQVNRSAVTGILITSLMRYILFLAALGVVMGGVKLAAGNPASDVFRAAAGTIGYKFFGMVMWAAAITSVIGASYTSVSFWKTFHPSLAKNEKWLISGFIIASTLIFVWIKQTPASILVFAGALNGMILPIALAIMLIAVMRRSLFPSYKHPVWMHVTGWIVVAAMGWLGVILIQKSLTLI